MTDVLARTIDFQRTGMQVLTLYFQSVGAFARELRQTRREGGESRELTAGQRAQIRLTVWRLQAAFETISRVEGPEGLREAMVSLSFLAETSKDTYLAWTELMDELVEEAERLYGTASGRGVYKREQVRAAILTIARREAADLPLASNVAAPFVFVAFADVLAGYVVAHLNENDLWDYAALPQQPRLAVRLTGPSVHYSNRILQSLGRLLTRIAWRIVMGSVRLSPGMRLAVDKVDPDVAGVLRSLDALVRFATNNREFVQAFAQIVSIATQQAEQFLGMEGRQKQAYAEELIMEFLRQNGFLAEGGLWEDVVRAWLRVSIDAAVHIYNRRGLFPFTPA